ncbi:MULTISPECIES: AI-2E family transporter [unclassified Corynebacterium]|uniref:AI-2E family transporter n=1 Tax=unclassified Corynebacterium TaxID=2624378 RepID=UPI0029CA0660|nr:MULTISPECIES: AI-2E family transporter [unclassified Corynebacterium]WPF65961.1 AI-2E family transporter [Corynebacterium sp. 22KM0430]WPF68454.1 AI-2E family transporter [Corynebacterium sp. 21KM1197]
MSENKNNGVPGGDQAAQVSPVARPSQEASAKVTEDFPAAVEALVEGAPRERAEDASHPEDSGEHITDRSLIIGRDGRWLAGWALRFIILVVAGVILWRGMGMIWVGLLPVLLALIICTVLWPPVSFLRKRRVPAALATILTMVGAFAAVIGIFSAIAPSVAKQIPELVNRASDGITHLQGWIQGPPLNLDLGEFDGVMQEVTSMIQSQGSNIASGVFSGISSASSAVVTLVMALVLTFFFLKDGTRFLPWLRKHTGGNVGWHLTEVLSRSWNTLAGFVRAQALVSFVDAFFIGLGLVLLNVPLALALAIITFFAGFIPIVGAFTAGALAVIIALVSNGLTNAIIVLVLIIAVQQIEGNVLQPIIQSKAMNLHAAIVLLAVTVGSALFGIIGAFLAVPVAAVFAVWFRYHSEMVALRAGEITIDDIQIATAQGEALTASEGMHAVQQRLSRLTRRKEAADEDEA